MLEGSSVGIPPKVFRDEELVELRSEKFATTSELCDGTFSFLTEKSCGKSVDEELCQERNRN